MILTNYHSHCNFCDGRAPLEEFVATAVAAGFTAYGVSSHAPLPFPTRWTLDWERVADYLAEVERLKQLYAGKIELYAGLEIDYLNEDQHPAIARFQQLPLDYRIGSVHLVYTDEGEVIDTDTGAEHFQLLVEQHFGGDLQPMVERYYAASVRMVELGGFDFIGHTDKISFNAEYCEPGVTRREWYRKLRETLFAAVAAKGMTMEINTKAFLKRNIFFPGQEHFAMIRQMGIPVVVNSDAHFPELINAGRTEALKALKQAGFRTVKVLTGGEWKEDTIN